MKGVVQGGGGWHGLCSKGLSLSWQGSIHRLWRGEDCVGGGWIDKDYDLYIQHNKGKSNVVTNALIGNQAIGLML